MEERWLSVAGWDGYEVSDWGRVRSWRVQGYTAGTDRRLSEPKLLVLTAFGRYGHLAVGFTRTPFSKHYQVHRLVLETFVGPCPEGMVCRHLDGDPKNNRVENLAWGTHEENYADSVRHGRNRYREEVDPEFHNDPFVPLEALFPWEVWRPIPRCSGYEISSYGRLRSYWVTGSRPYIRADFRIMSTARTARTHESISLKTDSGEREHFRVHRLVLEAFSPQPEPHLVCRHIDNDPSNNNIRNLKWGTEQENQWDRKDHRGEAAFHAKLTDDRVRAIRERRAAGERGCDLAREFGVSDGAIRKIYTRRSWRHVI